MAEKKQNPVVIGVLIVVIVSAVFFNMKKMMGPKRPRRRAREAITAPREVEMPFLAAQPQALPQPARVEKRPEKKFSAPTIKVELKRLTSGPAYDTQPVFSPDGREIAFISSNKKGQNIYILKFENSEEPVKLTQGDFWDSHPSWTPDGSKIIFSSNRRGKNNELFWVDKVTGNITPLNKPGTMPALNPDGEWLAFVEQHNIWVMRLSTKEFYPLTKSGYNGWPSWDRDGKKVYFSISGVIKASDIKGSEVASLTSSGFSDYPSVSSGNRLAYVSLESGRYDLWMANPDGTDKVQLTGDAAREYFPCWSPDGGSIVFASNASGPSNLWLLTLPK